MKKPQEQRKKKREGVGDQESGEREGNQEKRYATRRPRHPTLTKLRVQREHNVGTWPAHAPKRHTAGQESVPHAQDQW